MKQRLFIISLSLLGLFNVHANNIDAEINPLVDLENSSKFDQTSDTVKNSSIENLEDKTDNLFWSCTYTVDVKTKDGQFISIVYNGGSRSAGGCAIWARDISDSMEGGGMTILNRTVTFKE